jgi:hypothetical protein
MAKGRCPVDPIEYMTDGGFFGAKIAYRPLTMTRGHPSTPKTTMSS